MEKIDLETSDFNFRIIWNWSGKNLKLNIWVKLWRESFKVDGFIEISNVFENIRK